MSTKLAQPKPRMSSEERRAAIVHAACRLFAERGFRGTTTRELAAAVGVTEPVLYEHFRTKRDLYSAIIGEKAKAGITALAALRDHPEKRSRREPGIYRTHRLSGNTALNVIGDYLEAFLAALVEQIFELVALKTAEK